MADEGYTSPLPQYAVTQIDATMERERREVDVQQLPCVNAKAKYFMNYKVVG